MPRFPGFLRATGQVDLFYRAALYCGRCAGRPQGGQQQRRLAQGLPAALLPVRAVGVRRDRAQFGDEPGRISGPGPGVLGQADRDQRPQRIGHRLQRYRIGAMLGQQRLGGLPGERRAPGQALIEGGRGRVDIPGRAGRGAAELLRRRVGQRPGRDRPVPRPSGDAEIGQLAGTLAIDQHVLRLVVPVHHPPRVRCGQAQQRALQHHQRGLRGGLALPGQDLPQRDPIDQLHHDRRPRRRLGILIQPDHVRIIQRGQHPGLSAEHPRELRLIQQLPAQVLHRHQTARGILPGQHYFTEPPRPQHPQLGIPGNLPARHINRPPSGKSARFATPASTPCNTGMRPLAALMANSRIDTVPGHPAAAYLPAPSCPPHHEAAAFPATPVIWPTAN